MQSDHGGKDATLRFELPSNLDGIPSVPLGNLPGIQVPGSPVFADRANPTGAERYATLPSEHNALKEAPAPGPGSEDLQILLQHADREKQQLSALAVATASFQRRYAKLVPVRDQALLLRTSLGFEWNNYKDQRRFVSDSQNDFLDEATALCDSFGPDVSVERLQALHTQNMQDYEKQVENAKGLRESEGELSKTEFSLQQKERRLAQAAARMIEMLQQITLPEQFGTGPSSPQSEVSRPEMPPLIQHYFDKAGDVTIEREHLFTLELDQREARTQRMIEHDREQPPSMSDEEFEGIYLRAYAEAELLLAEAIKKAELAKAVCVSEGLDPEAYRNPLSQHDSVDTPLPSATPAEPAEADVHSSPGLEPTNEVQTPTKLDVLDAFSRSLPTEGTFLRYGPWYRPRRNDAAPVTERVQDWIEGVDPAEDTASRSRSISEARPNILLVEMRQDGTLGSNRSSPQAQDRRYQRHGSLSSLNSSLNKYGRERPALLKRSSSESALIIYDIPTGSREDLTKDLRSFKLRLR